jgi:hypothetical protein
MTLFDRLAHTEEQQRAVAAGVYGPAGTCAERAETQQKCPENAHPCAPGGAADSVAGLDESAFVCRAVEQDQRLRPGSLRLWRPWVRPATGAGTEGRTEGAIP